MKLYTLIPLLSLSLIACATEGDRPGSTQSGSTPSKQESARAIAAATYGLSAAQASALGQRSSLTMPEVENVEFSDDCELGGEFSISGTYEYGLESEDSEFDLTTSFTGCALPPGLLDGTLVWRQTITAGGHHETIKGDIAWQSTDGDAKCAFDLIIDVDDAGAHYSGIVCGYDVASELAPELDGSDD